jgi:hypothetical protein
MRRVTDDWTHNQPIMQYTQEPEWRSASSCSYTEWDRDAYIERGGGPEDAERRRKALMARQSGQRLADQRKQRAASPRPSSPKPWASPPGRVSLIECGELLTIEANARYVQALGGRLDSLPTSLTTPSQSPPPKPPDGEAPCRTATTRFRSRESACRR